MSASVIVIAGEDGRQIGKELRASLKSFTTVLRLLTVEDYLTHSKTDSGKVVVVVLTNLIWHEIDGLQNHDIIKLFGCPASTIAIFGTTTIRETAIAKLSRVVEGWRDIITFSCDRLQLIDAEAQIKRILVKMNDKEVYVSSATRYIIKPRKISSVSKENSSAYIILLEDQHYNFTKVGSVTVKEHGKHDAIPTKKIQCNIWSFNAAGLGPGRHEVAVYVDDMNFGSYKIKVESSLDIAKAAMRKELNENGTKLLANILKIEENSLDSELADIFSDSSHRKHLLHFIEGLLQFGENDKDHHATTLLDFCKKFGLRQFTEQVLDTDKAHDPSSTDLSDDEVLKPIDSPIGLVTKRPNNTENFARNPTDSGISSNGSLRNSIDTPKAPPLRISRNHFYNEIDENPYHKYTDDDTFQRLSEVPKSSRKSQRQSVEVNQIRHEQTNPVISTHL